MSPDADSDGDTAPERPSLMAGGVASRVRKLEAQVGDMRIAFGVIVFVLVSLLFVVAHMWLSLPAMSAVGLL